MKNIARCSLALLLLTSGLAVDSARADSLTVISSMGQISAPTIGTTFIDPAIQQFDPSLGTLNSITISFQSLLISETPKVHITYLGGVGRGTASFSIPFYRTELEIVNLPGGDSLNGAVAPNQNIVVSGTIFHNTNSTFSNTGFGGTFNEFGDLTETDLTDITAFTGTGTLSLGIFGATDANSSSIPCCGEFSGALTPPFPTVTYVGTDWFASVTVQATYDYTPASSGVPEPATLVLLGSGLLVVARRLRPHQ